MLPVGKKSHGVIGVVYSGEIARVATVCFAMEIPFWIKMISWDVPQVFFPATLKPLLFTLRQRVALYYILCFSPDILLRAFLFQLSA